MVPINEILRTGDAIMQLTEIFERQDMDYFNCLHSQIYSYMKYRKVPIDLILYRCLEKPHNLFHHMIVNGVSRWMYPFDIFEPSDFECIGIRLHRRNSPFHELKPDILRSLYDGEIVFISVDPSRLQHREEFKRQTPNGRHWLMITGIDRANNYHVLDEENTYYAAYHYEEKLLAEAFKQGRQRIVHFSRTEPNFEKLKDRYMDFYKNFPPVNDDLFDMKRFEELLEKDAGTMANRYFLTYRFFAGSMRITKRFLQFVQVPKEIADVPELTANLAENISAVIKKFELTGKINKSYIEEKMLAVRQRFDEITAFLRSGAFFDYLTSLSLSELAKQLNGLPSSSNSATREARPENVSIQQRPVDLKPYYNNQGFGNTRSPGDFTGGGEFFVIDETNSFHHVIMHENIEFHLCERPGHGYDNVSCQNQVIPLDRRVYNGIWLLGCGEWGDGSGNIGLQFEDGDVEEILVKLTDWVWQPKFGESIVLTLPIYRKEKLAFTPDEGHIFAVYYSILREKCACRLLLPHSPNLHLFSIVMTSPCSP